MDTNVRNGCLIFNNFAIINGAKNSVLYDMEREKIYSINKVAALIIRSVFEKKSKNDILTEFVSKYENINQDVFEKDIDDVLEFLGKENISLNENYTMENYHFEDKPYRRVWCELTVNCNYHCSHCYADASSRKQTSLLEKEFIFKFLNGIKNKDTLSLQLTGGEPFIRKDIKEIINYSSKLKFKSIGIFSNLSLFDDQMAEVVKENNIKLSTTLLGHNDNLHDSITNNKGSFQKFLKAVERVKKYNIEFEVGIIILKQNEEYIEDIKFLLTSMGIRYKSPDLVRPIGRGAAHSAKPDSLIPSQNAPAFKFNKMSFSYALQYNSCMGHLLTLRYDGKVTICPLGRDFIVGDIKEQSFEEIENSDKLKKYWNLNADSVEICKDCEYRYFCEDCRPLAFYSDSSESLYKKIPRCTYNPYIGKW